MVLFRPDGKYAFVCHSFTPELHVVDVKRKRVVKRIPVVSPFSPNLAVSADGREVWLTHKDVGKVTVVMALVGKSSKC
jgi:DNA-binding beta-propeller fold protein YncE